MSTSSATTATWTVSARTSPPILCAGPRTIIIWRIVRRGVWRYSPVRLKLPSLTAGVGAYGIRPVRRRDVHWTANAKPPPTTGRMLHPYTPIRAPYCNRTGPYGDTPLQAALRIRASCRRRAHALQYRGTQKRFPHGQRTLRYIPRHGTPSPPRRDRRDAKDLAYRRGAIHIGRSTFGVIAQRGVWSGSCRAPRA